MSYAFDNAWDRARQRLAAIEDWMDPGTIRHLEALGVGPGWRCLEVGAGGGSIAAWLARRVGLAGYVLATDLDTRFIDVLDAPNLESRRHDIDADPLPEGAFDLVHVRLVLAHLSARGEALRRMVAALRPGGWLLAEEMDFVSAVPDATSDPATTALVARAVAAHHRVLAGHCFDPFYGRSVASDLQAHGLVEIGTEGRLTNWRGGSPAAAAWRLTFVQLREELLADGDITLGEHAALLARFDDPGFAFMSQVILAAWGQSPPGVERPAAAHAHERHGTVASEAR